MPASTHETRERLIQAAIELIFSRGYTAVGVQELCERAKVKKGSFYHFFPSKRDLTLVALERFWQTFRVPIEACVKAPLEPLARIDYLFTALHQQYQGYLQQGQPLTGCPFGTLSMEVSAFDSELRAGLERVFDDWARLFELAFSDAVQAKQLPKNSNPAKGGRALLAYLEGILLMVKTTQNPDLIDRLRPSRTQLEQFAQP